MNKTAKDYVTIELEYDRPVFNFPELDSPQGNPIEYYKLATDRLKEAGFRREARELSSFKYKVAYEKSFNVITRFLDFTSSDLNHPYQEDENYMYYRVKKSSPLTIQNDIFKINTLQDIEDLISENHDFSIANCYERNHLHYLTCSDSLALLIKENKTKEWFDIFSLDSFNSTLLHGDRSVKNFTIILNEMISQNKDLAKTFLYGENVFEKNAFGEILSKLSSMFDGNNPNEERLSEVKDLLKAIGKIDKEKQSALIETLDECARLNQQELRTKIEPYGTKIFQQILNDELSNNESFKSKKAKI